MSKVNVIGVASSLAPHHRVEVVYPDIGLLESPEERRVLYLPYGHDQRYEPKPLIPVEEVIDNTYRDTEVSHLSILPIMPAKDKEHSGHGCLVDDIDQCCEWPGKTCLRVIVFRLSEDHHELKDIRVRIKRNTLSFDDEEDDEGTTHEISLEQLIKFTDTCERTWLVDIIDLIFQSTDRAVLSVRQNMPPGQNLEVTWKQDRGITVKEGLPRIVKILSLEDLGSMNEDLPDEGKITECPVCTERYGQSEFVYCDSRPAMLNCSKKHIVHFGCLEIWCKQNGMRDAKCFWCRVNIVDESVAPPLKPNYLDLDAPFTYDPDFTDWENWERSCADLDRTLAAFNFGARITVNPKRIMDVLKMILLGPPDIPGSQDFGTHHDLAVAPEVHVVARAIHGAAVCNSRDIVPLGDLYWQMMGRIWHHYRKECAASGIEDYFSEDFVKSMREGKKAAPCRPGFEKYVDNMLNRTLNFLVLRLCTEEREGVCGPDDENGFHRHGYRLYYRKKESEVVDDGEHSRLGEDEGQSCSGKTGASKPP